MHSKAALLQIHTKLSRQLQNIHRKKKNDFKISQHLFVCLPPTETPRFSFNVMVFRVTLLEVADSENTTPSKNENLLPNAIRVPNVASNPYLSV